MSGKPDDAFGQAIGSDDGPQTVHLGQRLIDVAGNVSSQSASRCKGYLERVRVVVHPVEPSNGECSQVHFVVTVV